MSPCFFVTIQALGALKESAKHAAKVAGAEKSASLAALNQRIATVERFVQARKLVRCTCGTR
jgi:hypothetical protein